MTFTPPDPHRIFAILDVFLADARQLLAQQPGDERISAGIAEVEAGLAQIRSGLTKVSAAFVDPTPPSPH